MKLAGCQGRNSQLAGHRRLTADDGQPTARPSLVAHASSQLSDVCIQVSDRRIERSGGFRSGEESYRYYFAVALYETGQYKAAKRELAEALKFIELTPDVAHYQAKIEGAIE